MNDGLGKRVYREYCCFALLLMALLVGFSDRLSSSAESQHQSDVVAAQSAARNR